MLILTSIRTRLLCDRVWQIDHCGSILLWIHYIVLCIIRLLNIGDCFFKADKWKLVDSGSVSAITQRIEASI